jgi:uncharacterized coiled-coil protein SlyX
VDLKESVANHDRQLERLRSSFDTNATTLRSTITKLSDRITKLEIQITSQPLAFAELKEWLARHEQHMRRLHSFVETNTITRRTECDDVRRYVQSLRAELVGVKSESDNQHETLVARIGTVERAISPLNREPERKISDSLSAVTWRLSACEESIEQIKAQCGNQSATLLKLTRWISPLHLFLHRQLRVQIHLGRFPNQRHFHLSLPQTHAKKSRGNHSLSYSEIRRRHSDYRHRNLGDLTSDSYFWSRNEPGQWVC